MGDENKDGFVESLVGALTKPISKMTERHPVVFVPSGFYLALAIATSASGSWTAEFFVRLGINAAAILVVMVLLAYVTKSFLEARSVAKSARKLAKLDGKLPGYFDFCGFRFTFSSTTNPDVRQRYSLSYIECLTCHQIHDKGGVAIDTSGVKNIAICEHCGTRTEIKAKSASNSGALEQAAWKRYMAEKVLHHARELGVLT